jgi:hypothetical protein
VLGVLIGFLVIAWLAEMAQARKRRALLPTALALGALAIAALLQLPSAGIYSLAGTPVVLTSERQEIVRDLELDSRVGSVVVDSYLENSAQLPTGTPFGEITLEAADGSRQRWLLRIGIESGEWAARREDVASQEGFEAPSPWLAWIPAGSKIFAQRYRARWDLPEPAGTKRLTITRWAELPPELGFAILHLELRP